RLRCLLRAGRRTCQDTSTSRRDIHAAAAFPGRRWRSTALVMVQLRYRGEAPALAVQFAVIGFLEIGHTGEPPIIAVGPAVIGASETRGIAAISTAEAIAAMPADIEKRAHGAGAVAHHQHRVLAHRGREEIARLGDLALMA